MSCGAIAICAGALLVGAAQVHDGDTLRVGGQSVRLQGVDAEELDEPHGRKARDVLIEIVGDGPVHCAPVGRSYKRVVAHCFTPAGLDLSAELIRRGAALDCARYSGGRFRAFEPSGVREVLRQKDYCHVSD